MTLYRFRLLSARAQLLCTLLYGTYLAQRGPLGHTIKLYYLCDGGRGFFAEVGIDETQVQFVVLGSFRTTGPLKAYATSVQLPSYC
jgi:hypothetical protein